MYTTVFISWYVLPYTLLHSSSASLAEPWPLTCPSDVFSIVLQAIGGGLASASDTMTILRVGDNVMITGLSVQVATILAFGALAADYAFAVRRNWTKLNPDTAVLRNSPRFKLFLGALCISYLCVLTRCCYR